MLEHLHNRGGSLDFVDTKELLAERDDKWNVSKNPQLYFNRVEKSIKGLARNEINSDLNEQRDMAQYYLKAAGKFDAACHEWEQKSAVDKTWRNIKTFISAEYAKENKQNKDTTKHIEAHTIQEHPEATKELIATLMEPHTHQLETFTKSTTNSMKEMMLLIKDNRNLSIYNSQSNEETKKKRDEKCKKYYDTPICKHCNRKHSSKAKDECWE
jgi:hypothetical protein